MTLQYLIDTNTLSEPTRHIPNAKVMEKLNVHKSEISVASVVVHELLYGCWRLPESRRREIFLNYYRQMI